MLKISDWDNVKRSGVLVYKKERKVPWGSGLWNFQRVCKLTTDELAIWNPKRLSPFGKIIFWNKNSIW